MHFFKNWSLGYYLQIYHKFNWRQNIEKYFTKNQYKSTSRSIASFSKRASGHYVWCRTYVSSVPCLLKGTLVTSKWPDQARQDGNWWISLAPLPLLNKNNIKNWFLQLGDFLCMKDYVPEVQICTSSTNITSSYCRWFNGHFRGHPREQALKRQFSNILAALTRTLM